jgi:hypothetical protein
MQHTKLQANIDVIAGTCTNIILTPLIKMTKYDLDIKAESNTHIKNCCGICKLIYGTTRGYKKHMNRQSQHGIMEPIVKGKLRVDVNIFS